MTFPAAASVESSVIDVFEGVRHRMDMLQREKAHAQDAVARLRQELDEERQRAKQAVLKWCELL